MLLPRSGLCQAIQYVLRLKPMAIAIGGPPCSSWVWINAATSRRRENSPFGDVSREYVRSSNKLLGYLKIQWPCGCWVLIAKVWADLSPTTYLRLTTRWTLLLLLCVARSVFSLTEQPNSSLMPKMPYMKYLVLVMKKLGLHWGQIFLFPGCM